MAQSEGRVHQRLGAGNGLIARSRVGTPSGSSVPSLSTSAGSIRTVVKPWNRLLIRVHRGCAPLSVSCTTRTARSVALHSGLSQSRLCRRTISSTSGRVHALTPGELRAQAETRDTRPCREPERGSTRRSWATGRSPRQVRWSPAHGPPPRTSRDRACRSSPRRSVARARAFRGTPRQLREAPRAR